MWDPDFLAPPDWRVAGEMERRSAERFPPNSSTVCRVLDPIKCTSNQVGIRDLSSSGISLVLASQVEIGTLLHLELELRTLRFVHRLTAKVQHNGIQLPNESWLHGCVFAKPLPERVVEAFTQ